MRFLFLLLFAPCAFAQLGFVDQGLRNVVPDGLVGYWPMDETAGQTASDLSGGSNSGYATNSPTWTSGIVRGALLFNGSTQCVIAAGPSVTGDITICAWVLFNAKIKQSIVAKGVYNTSRQYGLEISDNLAALGFTYNLNGFKASSAVSLTTNVWYFLTASLASGTVSFYTNSSLISSTAAATISTTNTGSLLIGAADAYNIIPINGRLDEVRIYNRSLSSNEIMQLYMAGH